MTVDPSDRYQDGTYQRAHPQWHEEDAGHKARAVWQFVNTCGLNPSHLVDVGCGYGGVCRRLKDVWPRVEGWDVAEVAIQHAQRADPGSTYVHGDFHVSGRHVPMVLLMDVVEHIKDDVEFLRELGQRCDDLILRVPLDWSVLDQIRPHRMQRARDKWGHLHIYTRQTLNRRLREAGLSILHATYDRVPPGPPETGWGHLTEALRRTGHPLAPAFTAWLLGGFSLFLHARAECP